MFFMTRTLTKNVRIAIVAAGTITFWKMDFRNISMTVTLRKICKDHHRIGRDIHILKNGFQNHSSWPVGKFQGAASLRTFTFSKMDFRHIHNKQFFYTSSGHIYSWNWEDRHCSRREIHIFQNWISDTSLWPEHWQKREDRHRSRRDNHILKNGFQACSSWPEHWQNVRIAIVAAGTFLFWKMDSRNISMSITLIKICKDHHRWGRDIHILKNGFQTHSSWPVGKFQGAASLWTFTFSKMDFEHILNKQSVYISLGHIYSWNWEDSHRSRWDICKIGFQTHTP